MSSTTTKPGPGGAGPIATGLCALLLCVAGTVVALLACGPTLGLLFGGVACATLVVPPLVAPATPAAAATAVAGAVVGACGVWAVAFARVSENVPHATGWEVARASAVLAAVAAAQGGGAALARVVSRSATIAAATAVVAGIAWLSFPVWLGTPLRDADAGALARFLVSFHPLFAINGVVPHLGVWLQHGIIYRHVTLGQDVAYALPARVFPCVLAHAFAGVAGFAIARPAPARRMAAAPAR